jgi:Flp pilus assembly protein CpaB
MLAGVLLVGLSLVGGLLLWRGATDSTPILVADRTLPPGHVIQRDDLRIAEARLDGSLASLALRESDLEGTVGQTVTTPVHAGEMLIRPDLAAAPILRPDEVAITVPIAADTIYPGLRPTDQVAILATANVGRPESTTVTLLDRATVFAVGLERRTLRSSSTSGADDGVTVTHVTLAIPRTEAEAIVDAVKNGTVTIALLAPQETTVQP